jgi:GntR family transcriptional regulator, transcriptional repressor for pyruvate dehydrogenase complex
MGHELTVSASAPLFSPLRRTRASGDIVAQIRSAIFSGRLRPGDRLPTERELTEQFGVSRVTVRDALRALETSGLIHIRVGGHGGAFIAEPDVSTFSESLGTHLLRSGTTFREVAEARLALETTAARLACERATEEDLEAIRVAVHPTDQPSSSATASLAFHEAVVTAAHNHAIQAIFVALRGLMEEAFAALRPYPNREPEDIKLVHSELYEAIAAHDSDRAVRLMREHLYDNTQRVEKLQELLGDNWYMQRESRLSRTNDEYE